VLVFTRKLNQAIVIGEGVEVKVLRIGRDAVRLGVTAAASVPVHRQEVYDQIRQANRAAVAVGPGKLDEIVARLRGGRPPAAGHSA
jgi:carbon storage regulator